MAALEARHVSLVVMLMCGVMAAEALSNQTEAVVVVGSGPTEGLLLVLDGQDTHATIQADEGLQAADSPVAHQVASPGRVSATEPYIDPATPVVVKAFAGLTAIMPCIVNNLGQRSVSWVRHRDIHVLTVGRFTFTNDDRFEAHHEDGSNEWVLKLRSPTTNDSGIYECQINTKPTRTQLITLRVVEPQAVITAGAEKYIDLGSSLQLTCRVVNAPSTSKFLLWYHEEKVANYEVEHVRVSMRHENGSTYSSLTLDRAQVHNSGTYTCSPSNAREASIRVHVLSGEHPAAMQTNNTASAFPQPPSVPVLCLLSSGWFLTQADTSSLLKLHLGHLLLHLLNVTTFTFS